MNADLVVVGSYTDYSPNRLSIDEYEAQLKRKGRITPIVEEALAKARQERSRNDVVIYVAGGLTGVEEAMKQRYVQLSELIAGRSAAGSVRMFGYVPHMHGTDPRQHPDVTPAEVRDIDHLWSAIVPDLHMSFMFPIAHGNAIEAAWAEERGVPVVYIVPSGMTTSRLVRGMWNALGTITYDDFQDDGLRFAGEFLDILKEAVRTK